MQAGDGVLKSCFRNQRLSPRSQQARNKRAIRERPRERRASEQTSERVIHVERRMLHFHNAPATVRIIGALIVNSPRATADKMASARHENDAR